MAKTIYRQSNERVVNERLKGSEWKDLYVDYMLKLNNGYFQSDMVDAIIQKFRPPYDIYDAAAFAAVWSWCQFDYVRALRIGPIGPCFADKKVEKNNNRLANLPWPFMGEFWGEHHCETDGYLEWVISINMNTEDEPEYVQPLKVPLEVGYCSAEKTFFYLWEMNGIARWPYHSKDVWLFLVTPKGRDITLSATPGMWIYYHD